MDTWNEIGGLIKQGYIVGADSNINLSSANSSKKLTSNESQTVEGFLSTNSTNTCYNNSRTTDNTTYHTLDFILDGQSIYPPKAASSLTPAYNNTQSAAAGSNNQPAPKPTEQLAKGENVTTIIFKDQNDLNNAAKILHHHRICNQHGGQLVAQINKIDKKYLGRALAIPNLKIKLAGELLGVTIGDSAKNFDDGKEKEQSKNNNNGCVMS